MSILNSFTANGSILSNLNGQQGPQPDFSQSKLHDEYSINGDPFVKQQPSPSTLSLKGITPPGAYKNNAPEGRSF